MKLLSTSTVVTSALLVVLGRPSVTFAQVEPCGPYTIEHATRVAWPGMQGATIVRLAGEIVFDGRGHKGANEIVERNCDIDLARLNDQASIQSSTASLAITEFENYGS